MEKIKIKNFYSDENFGKKRKISPDLVAESKEYLEKAKKTKDLKIKQEKGESISDSDLAFLRQQQEIVAERRQKRMIEAEREQERAKEAELLLKKEAEEKLKEENSIKPTEVESLLEDNNEQKLEGRNELSRRNFLKWGAFAFSSFLGGKQLLKILDDKKEDIHREDKEESAEEIDEEIEEESESQEQMEIKKSDRKIIGKTIEDQLKTSDQIILNLETKNALWKKWKDSYSPRPENYSGDNLELGKNYLGLIKSMERMQPWLKPIREEFRKVGIPEKFAYVAIPESHFKLKDYSVAQARGPYQFIKSSAKLFNLRVDDVIDDRCDPVRSARACAEHLKDSYERFNNDWDLAFADYNGGFTNSYAKHRKREDRNYKDFLQWREDRINNFIKKKKKNELAHKVKAGDNLFKISKIYGIPIEQIKKSNNLEGEDISVDQVLKIDKESNFDISDLSHSLENLNYPEKFYAILDVIEEQGLEKKYDESQSLSFEYLKVPKGNYFEKKYEVQEGDGLFGIARGFRAEIKKTDIKARVSAIDILNLIKTQNGIKDVAKIYPGQKINFKAEINGNASLATISEKYGYDLNQLLALNPAVKNSKVSLPSDYEVRVPKK